MARAAGFPLRDEAGSLENAQVLHYRRQAHAVRAGQFRDGGLAVCQR